MTHLPAAADSIEVQQPSSALAPSLIRSLIPFLAGVLGTWLLDVSGVDLDSNVLAVALSAVIGYLYYVVARFAEVFVSDKWGYVLGIRKTPVYAPKVPGTVVAVEQGDPAAGIPVHGEFTSVEGVPVAEPVAVDPPDLDAEFNG